MLSYYFRLMVIAYLPCNLLTHCTGLLLEDESYDICPSNYSHTFPSLNSSGILTFNNSEQGISCSVNLLFPPGSVETITFKYVIDEECYSYRTCNSVPNTLKTNRRIFCPTSYSYASTWTKTDYVRNDAGNILVQISGSNTPVMQPFKLHYWIGEFSEDITIHYVLIRLQLLKLLKPVQVDNLLFLFQVSPKKGLLLSADV